MGDADRINMGDNSWAENDLTSSLDALTTGCGVYDFSGTVPNHVYAEHNCSISKADIDSMTKTWWDGSSAGWSSDAEYAELARTGHKAEGNGLKCMLMGRNEFGDGGCQHIIAARQGKKGIVMAHADFTVVVGYFKGGRLPCWPSRPRCAKPHRILQGGRLLTCIVLVAMQVPAFACG